MARERDEVELDSSIALHARQAHISGVHLPV